MATNPLIDTHFQISINTRYQDKVRPGDGRFYEFNRTFENVELTAWLLLGHIGAGHAWTQPHVHAVEPGKHTYRTKWAVEQFELQNGASIQAFAFDAETHDERSTLRWWTNDELFGGCGMLVHTTASHTDARPRCRVVWVLDEPIGTAEYSLARAALQWHYAFRSAPIGRSTYRELLRELRHTPDDDLAQMPLPAALRERIQTALAHRETDVDGRTTYAQALALLRHTYTPLDASVNHAAAVYYGARGCSYLAPGRLLPVATLRDIIAAHQEAQEAETAARQNALPAQPAVRVAGENANALYDRYVATAVEDELAGLAALTGGHGMRHDELRRVSTRLASLAAASWHSCDTAGLQQRLLEACRTNGYIADYGEDAAGRAIRSAFDDPAPAYKPALTGGDAGSYVEIGAAVEVRMPDGRRVRGQVAQMRQAGRGGHWEACVSGVWFPKAWLNPVATQQTLPEDDAAAQQAQQPAEQPPRPTEQPPRSANRAGRANMPADGRTTAVAPPAQPARATAVPPPPPPPDDAALLQQQSGIDEIFAAVDVEALRDGRQRDIYAHLATPDTRTIDIQPGAYLTDDVLPYDSLPRLATLHANTGVGKTSFALAMPGQRILVTSTTAHLEQLHERHPDADCFYSAIKNASSDSELILTTYESFGGLLQRVDASRFALIVDEVHNFAASSDRAFRGRALNAVMDTLNGAWRQVLLITGTPVPLCHPNMRQFTQLNVRSHVRAQFAQRVVWQRELPDGRTQGSLLDAIAALCDTSQRHLIYLNNKKRAEQLIGRLVAAGWQRDGIALFNSDTKHDAIGRAIVEGEQVPDDVRVLITTQLAVEALNIRSGFDCVHLASDIHSHHAQQIVNRLRTSAAGRVYWYNSGGGRGFAVPVAEFQAHFLRQAQRVAADLNQLDTIDPNDDSAAGILARRSMRLYSQAALRLVRVDEQLEDGRRWWDIDYLGIDNTVFDAVAEYTRRNPIAFKNALLPYGWAWLEDIEQIVAQRDSGRRAQAAAVTAELRDAREKAHLARVEQLQQAGFDEVRRAARRHEDGATMRAAQQIVATFDAIGATHKQQQAFETCCELVGIAQDSKAQLNRLHKQIRIQHLRRDGDAFTLALLGAFKVGETLTSAEIQQRVVDTYDRHEVMRLASRPARRYPFSTEDEQPITPTRATRLLSDLYQVRRTSQRDADGNVVHVYEVAGEHAAAELVATFVVEKINTKKTGYKSDGRAFAGGCLHEKPAAQSANVATAAATADEIPFTADEIAQYEGRAS